MLPSHELPERPVAVPERSDPDDQRRADLPRAPAGRVPLHHPGQRDRGARERNGGHAGVRPVLHQRLHAVLRGVEREHEHRRAGALSAGFLLLPASGDRVRRRRALLRVPLHPVSGRMRPVPHRGPRQYTGITCSTFTGSDRVMRHVRPVRFRFRLYGVQLRRHPPVLGLLGSHGQRRRIQPVPIVPLVQRGLRIERVHQPDSIQLRGLRFRHTGRDLQRRQSAVSKLSLQRVYHPNHVLMCYQLRFLVWAVFALRSRFLLFFPDDFYIQRAIYSGVRPVPRQLLLRWRHQSPDSLPSWNHLPQPRDVAAPTVSSRLLLPNHWTGYPLPGRFLLPVRLFGCHSVPGQHMGDQY